LLHARDAFASGSSVLDIGCGVGYMLEVLQRDFDCITYGCDVVEPPVDIDRFALFDGNDLPFHDKSIDVAILTFVLHHADDPSELLHEASRVARRAVIVVEDTPNNALERRWGRMHVHSFKTRHGIPWHGHVREEAEWRQIFQFMGMPVQQAERLGRFERVPPIARMCFVLRPLPAQPAAAAAARTRRATS
jgi:ubiquinone/menaquinone biosynthesis C-methylase UbiE